MADFTIRRIDEMEAIYGGAFKRARAELGLGSFGAQVIDMPANFDGYPEHDHSKDGQEELYVVLRGGGEMLIDGEAHAIDPDTMLAIQPGTTRKLVPGPDGIRVLIVGGVAGQPDEAPDITNLGQPDPMAASAP